MQKKSQTSTSFLIFWLIAISLGIFLRSYLLLDQIIIDDEWHALNYVIDRPFFYIASNLGLGANSIPLNIYAWILLNTIGWSEILLHLPSFISGILALVIFPFIIKRIFNDRTAIIFSFLLSISPCLIFYSRFFRPYSMVVFCSFIAFFSLLHWIKTADHKYAILYVSFAVSAIYLHTYSLLMVFSPLCLFLCIKIFHLKYSYFKEKIFIAPEIHEILINMGLVFCLICILNLPAYLKNPWWLTVLSEDHVTLHTLKEYISIISGTSHVLLISIFVLCFLCGIVFLYYKKPILCLLISMILFLFLCMMIISRQQNIYTAIIVIRYSIASIPLIFVTIAFGLDQLLEKLNQTLSGFMGMRILIFIIPFGLLINAFTFGPISDIYKTPNNFTNHSAFQDSYMSRNWLKSRSRAFMPGFIMDKKNISPFYFKLSLQPDVQKIIEYPMFMGDTINLYYYYQHFHKKKIIAGYLTRLKPDKKRNEDFIQASFTIGYVMSRIKQPDKMKFKNMINMENIKAIRNSASTYIILHKHLIDEMFPFLNESYSTHQEAIRFLSELYFQTFGNPVFTDNKIIVFQVK